MKFLNTSAFIEKANTLAKDEKPFLFIIGFDPANTLIFTDSEIEDRGIRFSFDEMHEVHKMPNRKLRLERFPVSFEVYLDAFNRVKEHLKRGDTFLVNLTFPTHIVCNFSLAEIYQYSKAKYKLLMPDKWVVFSPEPFIRISGGRISTFPMKGTADAGLPNAASKLLADPKELAEHHTIVDLLRNDLSMIALDVKVDRFRYLEKVKTHHHEIYQTSSAISGKLPVGWKSHLGEFIMKLLPAGSISGAPKKKTVEIIQSVETTPRGFFTGIFGYFNGEELNSAVMIRYIEYKNEKLIFRSGGGITYYSDPIREYEEMIQKVYVPVI